MPPSAWLSLSRSRVNVQDFLLGAALRVGENVVELAQTADRGRDRLPVGQRAAEPAMVDEVLGRLLGGFSDRIRSLALGGHEQHAAAAGGGVGHLHQCLMQHRHGLGQVENVDVVAGAVDKGRHLGVPAMRLVAEVNASFQELTHVELRARSCAKVFLFRLILRVP